MGEGGGGRIGGGDGQGICERRSEVFVKFQKKMGGRGRVERGWGIRVDVYGEVFCENHFFGGGEFL